MRLPATTRALAFAILALLGLRVLAMTPPHEVGDLRKSVFLLRAQIPEPREERTCTAFAVDHDTFVTAAHCVEEAAATLSLRDETGRYWPATIEVFWADMDTATLRSEMPATALPLGKDPREDEAVLIVSAVGGYDIYTLRGRGAGAYEGKLPVLQVFGQAEGGSGAPILCEDDKKVCGLTTGVLNFSGLTVTVPTSMWEPILEKK